MTQSKLIGSLFEASLRILLILDEIHAYSLDEQQIACIDFIAIYGANFNILDSNLHGSGIFSYSEFSAKSVLVSEALKKLVLTASINFVSNDNGFSYHLNNNGKLVVNQLKNTYSEHYRIAINEIQFKFPTLNANEMQKIIYDTSLVSLED